MIAATARSTGDEYVVADSDFEAAPLEEVIDVTNLHPEKWEFGESETLEA